MQSDLKPNGGVIAQLGKSSWLLGMLLTLGTAGIGGYFAVKQDLTVGLATLQLQVSQNEAQINQINGKVATFVPAEVHQTRQEMQKEIDKWHEAYVNERFSHLEDAVKMLQQRSR